MYCSGFVLSFSSSFPACGRTGGEPSSMIYGSNESVATLFNKSTWKRGQMPVDVFNSTECESIAFVVWYFAFNNESFFDS